MNFQFTTEEIQIANKHMCTSHEPCQIFLALELSYGLWTLIPAPAIVKDTDSEGTLTNFMQVQPNRTSSNLCQAHLTSSLRLFGWQDNLTPIHAEPRSVWESISHDTYLWLVEDTRQWMNSSPFFLPHLLWISGIYKPPLYGILLLQPELRD